MAAIDEECQRASSRAIASCTAGRGRSIDVRDGMILSLLHTMLSQRFAFCIAIDGAVLEFCVQRLRQTNTPKLNDNLAYSADH